MAEFCSAGPLIGFTRFDDGDLMLRIEPRDDGAPMVVGAQHLADAIAEANRLLRV